MDGLEDDGFGCERRDGFGCVRRDGFERAKWDGFERARRGDSGRGWRGGFDREADGFESVAAGRSDDFADVPGTSGFGSVAGGPPVGGLAADGRQLDVGEFVHGLAADGHCRIFEQPRYIDGSRSSSSAAGQHCALLDGVADGVAMPIASDVMAGGVGDAGIVIGVGRDPFDVAIADATTMDDAFASDAPFVRGAFDLSDDFGAHLVDSAVDSGTFAHFAADFVNAKTDGDAEIEWETDADGVQAQPNDAEWASLDAGVVAADIGSDGGRWAIAGCAALVLGVVNFVAGFASIVLVAWLGIALLSALACPAIAYPGPVCSGFVASPEEAI